MIQVTCKLQDYEESPGKDETILVVSDHIWDDRVHIEIGDKRVCVITKDMITAIENATQTR